MGSEALAPELPFCAGRTDAGVSSVGQLVSFHAPAALTEGDLDKWGLVVGKGAARQRVRRLLLPSLPDGAWRWSPGVDAASRWAGALLFVAAVAALLVAAAHALSILVRFDPPRTAALGNAALRPSTAM